MGRTRALRQSIIGDTILQTYLAGTGILRLLQACAPTRTRWHVHGAWWRSSRRFLVAAMTTPCSAQLLTMQHQSARAVASLIVSIAALEARRIPHPHVGLPVITTLCSAPAHQQDSVMHQVHSCKAICRSRRYRQHGWHRLCPVTQRKEAALTYCASPHTIR